MENINSRIIRKQVARDMANQLGCDEADCLEWLIEKQNKYGNDFKSNEPIDIDELCYCFDKEKNPEAYAVNEEMVEESYIDVDDSDAIAYKDQKLYRVIGYQDTGDEKDDRPQMYVIGIGSKTQDEDGNDILNGFEPVVRAARYTTEESFVFTNEERAYKFFKEFRKTYPDANMEGLHVAEYKPLHPVLKLIPITSPCGNAYIGLQKVPPKKDEDEKDEALAEAKKRKIKVTDGGVANVKGGSINNAFFNRAMGHPVDAGDFTPAADGVGDAGGEGACCGESLTEENINMTEDEAFLDYLKYELEEAQERLNDKKLPKMLQTIYERRVRELPGKIKEFEDKIAKSQNESLNRDIKEASAKELYKYSVYNEQFENHYNQIVENLSKRYNKNTFTEEAGTKAFMYLMFESVQEYANEHINENYEFKFTPEVIKLAAKKTCAFAMEDIKAHKSFELNESFDLFTQSSKINPVQSTGITQITDADGVEYEIGYFGDEFTGDGFIYTKTSNDEPILDRVYKLGVKYFKANNPEEASQEIQDFVSGKFDYVYYFTKDDILNNTEDEMMDKFISIVKAGVKY